MSRNNKMDVECTINFKDVLNMNIPRHLPSSCGQKHCKHEKVSASASEYDLDKKL